MRHWRHSRPQLLQGLLKGMSAQQQRDLLTFLLMPAPGEGKN
jgi:hypothetical protein